MITLDNYVMHMIKEYPTLYAAKSYKEAKMKVLDQLLNVIGNGIRDDDELTEHLQYIKPNVTLSDIANHVSGEPMYYGYTKVTTYEEDGKILFTSPDSQGKTYYGVLESEKYKYPDVVYWMACSYHEHKPYPNFKEDYSIVYKCPSFFNLHHSFIEGAIEFYEYVKDWFKDNESKYSYAFPCTNEPATKRRTRDLELYIKKYKTYEEISEAYGTPFTGDLYQFQVDKWLKEKNRIFIFIEETLSMLKKKVDKSTNN